jgi:glycosyltransferase 2 family protein
MTKHASPGRLRSALILLAKIVVSVGLLMWLFRSTDLSRLWDYVAKASFAWLAIALVLYLAQLLVSAWRWGLLLDAQHVQVPWRKLVDSYMVAYFFNNFLPSNIGGDVVRVRDTAGDTGSKTLATTVILFDRVIGVMALMLIAAVGATSSATAGEGRLLPWTWLPPLPWVLWPALVAAAAALIVALERPGSVALLLHPLRTLHAEWVGERIERVVAALGRFRDRPQTLVWCFVGAICVQGILVVFYLAIVRSMGIPVPLWHLAVIIPLSFVVQMLPISVNGFGVREATFTVYFHQIGLPRESALVVSFMGAALMLLFSLSGAVAYVARGAGRDAPMEAPEPEVLNVG